ncbi:hypothetical protein B0H13DRAFT_1921545 [Mycena leptocephala]|nr:hypothetical protein B0H13DRAFT_1921545 [Mycena leptocephala]
MSHSALETFEFGNASLPRPTTLTESKPLESSGYFNPEQNNPPIGEIALALLDERDTQENVIKTAKENVANINLALEVEDAMLDQEIKRLNGLITETEEDIKTGKARQVQGKRAIEKKESELAQVMSRIEDIIGKEEMQKWKATLGDEKKNKPALPQSMHGVTGNAIKAYIGGPMVPTQDGQGLVAVGGVSGSRGGERDEVPLRNLYINTSNVDVQ